MATINPRSLLNEVDWLPSTLDEALAIRQVIVDAGYAPHVANGVMAWLIAKAGGQPDDTSEPTRWRYRNLLAELDPLPQLKGRTPRMFVHVADATRAA